ncbi:Cellulose synthase-like protein [Drosera capensis]
MARLMRPSTVTFSRRTASGRYVNFSRDSRDNLSRDDLDSEIGSGEYMNYTVHIPPTPDNQPMDPTISQRVEVQYVSNSIFTGGFNSVTRAHLMDKVIDSEATHPQMAGVKGSSCAVPGCDGKVMKDERGNDILPCECDFKICRDCYIDAAKGEDASCPGCKEPYKLTDLHEKAVDSEVSRLPLSSPDGMSQKSRNMSLAKHSKSGLIRSVTAVGEFDHNRWLFETRGTYGYGNAIWPKEAGYGIESDDGVPLEPMDFLNKPWRPLTRKLRIPAAVISPYRLLVLVRLVALALFLTWRVRNPNPDAPWLWGMSVVCEIWFAFSWILDQLPKLNPVSRLCDLSVLKEKFEIQGSGGQIKSDLPGVDIFVSTADPEKEPPLVTANTILSILAADYPVEKLSCYVSDDGGALLTFEAMAEAASFANLWVPFCRKHDIEPRNPESYFNLKRDPYRNKVRQDFVKDRRRMKREYDEFKVRINGLPDSIRRRSDAFNAREEIKALKRQKEQADEDPIEPLKSIKATWMADATHWPGTWMTPAPEHSKGDHAGIIQVMLKPPSDSQLLGSEITEDNPLNFNEVDIRLPLLVYVSREKRPGYDHNKKAGAMNALVRASAIMSNGAFILNLDCDHYIYNSQAIQEGMCFMMDRGGDRLCYVQFPQRFEGIDPSDRYANHNTVFFDVNMRALDGLQGPVYVGTGCLFRRIALYGFDPPRSKDHPGIWSTICCCFSRQKKNKRVAAATASPDDHRSLRMGDSDEEDGGMNLSLLPKRFGNSNVLVDSIPVAEFQGRPLKDHPTIQNGRPPGSLTISRDLLEAPTVAEAISVISCWYEDKTEWGGRIGWIYGSVTEDVVTGYRMHNRGWRSVYCVTKRDAFRGTAPINLTDRLHQVLRWATGSVEIFFSRNNALVASTKMKLLQRMAYLNVGIYPFTSVFLIVYCFLPALSLFSGQFIVQTLSITFLVYLLLISITLCMLALLEIKWSGITLEEWWRNEQFWLIGGTSAHIAAVLQGLLKVVAGIEISFTLTSKSGGEDDDEFADLYVIKWTSLMIPPIVIIMVNLVAIAVGFSRTIYSSIPQWSKLLGGVFFSFWVLAHLYPFAKGLMGRRGRTPTIVYVWSGLIAITISLLWVAIKPPAGATGIGGSFSFP